jgi:integrase
VAIYPDRKDGKLTGRFCVQVMRDGKRQFRRAKSHAEAKRLEAKLVAALENGEDPTPPSRLRKLPDDSPKTIRDCIRAANGKLWRGIAEETASFRKLEVIASIVGDRMPIDSFDTNTVDEVTVELEGRGRSEATINRYISAMSKFLKFCTKRGLMTSPLPDLEWRKLSDGRIRWITYDEEKRLMELLPAPYSTLVYVAIRTGLRASELLNLKSDQVEPAWVHLWGDGTKSGKSRSVPLSPQLYKSLAPLVSRKEIPSYRQLNLAWEKARKAMGLSSDPTFVFHSCRHTYATRSVQAGVNIRVLQKLLGHASIQTTLRYAHVDDRTLSDAALTMMAFHDGKVQQISAANPPALHRGERLQPQNSAETRWRSVSLSSCKSAHAGSIPARASKGKHIVTANDD